MPEDYERLLRDHDDPKYWACPPGFEFEAAIERFRKLHRSLEHNLDMRLEAETGLAIQDASFHSQIRLGTFDREIVVIRFSNFRDMIAISGEECLPIALRKRILETLQAHAYVYVPESLLQRPYTGDNPVVNGIRDWWIRFFDWV